MELISLSIEAMQGAFSEQPVILQTGVATMADSAAARAIFYMSS